MLRAKRLVALSFGTSAVVSALLAGVAHADTVNVTAAVANVTGVRTITSAPDVVMAAGATNLSGTLAVTVTETAKLGTSPWSVTAASSALTTSTDSIPASNLTLAPAAPVVTGGYGAGASAGTAGTLDSTQTLFRVSGESTTTAYTGSYAGRGALTLAIPNGTASGTYTGVITVTLIG